MFLLPLLTSHWLHAHCTLCDRPLTLSWQRLLCDYCKKTLPWHYAPGIAFHYDTPIKHWLTALKFKQQTDYARFLAELFITRVATRRQWPDCIIPIPLHRQRLCQRGFNQSIEIAKHIARTKKIPLLRNALTRIKKTTPQTELSAHDRLHNLTGAFTYRPRKQYKHIVLFDDVITTGSTMKAAIEAIQATGHPHAIEVWAVAKTARVSSQHAQALRQPIDTS